MQIAVENSQELLKREEFGSTKPSILQVSCVPLLTVASHVFLFIFKLRTSTYFQSAATQLYTLLCIQ